MVSKRLHRTLEHLHNKDILARYAHVLHQHKWRTESPFWWWHPCPCRNCKRGVEFWEKLLRKRGLLW